MAEPTRLGRYTLVERLHTSGVAEVYLAVGGNKGFEQAVAIKKILPQVSADPEFLEPFLDEARIAVQLSHANLVHVLEVGEETPEGGEAVDTTHYLAMEFLSGRTLAEVTARLKPNELEPRVALATHVVSKVLEGLDHASRKADANGRALNIVHRAISPANVLVTYSGEVKVLDFGTARAANRAQRTQVGVLKGKLGYLSPEQLRSGEPVDRRADLFAVGVVLWELLTGQRLFPEGSQEETLSRIDFGAIDPPSALNPYVPEPLDAVVLQALAAKPEKRFGWASEMETALAPFAANSAFKTSNDVAAFMRERFPTEHVDDQERLRKALSVARPSAPRAPTQSSLPKVNAPSPRPSVTSLPKVATPPPRPSLDTLPKVPTPPARPSAAALPRVSTPPPKPSVTTPSRAALAPVLAPDGPDEPTNPSTPALEPVAAPKPSVGPPSKKNPPVLTPSPRKPTELPWDVSLAGAPEEPTAVFVPAAPSPSVPRPPPGPMPKEERTVVVSVEHVSLDRKPSAARLRAVGGPAAKTNSGATVDNTDPVGTPLDRRVPPSGVRRAPQPTKPMPVAALLEQLRTRRGMAIAGGALAFVLVLVVLLASLGGGDAQIVVRCVPNVPDCKVTIGGQLVRLDAATAWAAGDYDLVAVAKGYRSHVQRVTVLDQSEPTEVTVLLEAVEAPAPVVDAGASAPASFTARFVGSEGAEVTLDGVVVGRVPSRSEGLQVGRTYSWLAKKPGFEPATGTVVGKGAGETTVVIELRKLPEVAVAQPQPVPQQRPTPQPRPQPRPQPKPAPPPTGAKGFLIFTSDPPGAEVLIDGRPTGRKTPVLPDSPLEIAAGSHVIELRLKDAKSKPRKVVVAAGQVASLPKVKLDEVVLLETPDVE